MIGTTSERVMMWVGVTADHSHFLVKDNPNSNYVNMRLTTLDDLLFAGGIMREEDRHSMQAICKEWNTIVKNNCRGDFRRFLTHPAMAVFSITISDRRKKKEVKK